jgi:hypothetical protein
MARVPFPACLLSLLSLVDSIPVERTCFFLIFFFFFFFLFSFGSPSSSYLVMMTASFPRSGFSSSGSLSSGIYLSSCLSLSLSRMSPFEENDDGPSATHPSNVKSTRTPPPSPKSCLFVQPKTHCVCGCGARCFSILPAQLGLAQHGRLVSPS